MKPDDAVVADIIAACGKIADFVAGQTQDGFRATSIIQSAVIRELEVVGEAAKRLSSRFRAEHEQIPWKQVAGMRDRLIHGYDDIDLEAVWRVATSEVPALRDYLQRRE